MQKNGKKFEKYLWGSKKWLRTYSSLKTSLLKWRPDYENAADEYNKAATCFRNAKSYQQCKECLLKTVDCHKQNRAYPYTKVFQMHVNLLDFIPKYATFICMIVLIWIQIIWVTIWSIYDLHIIIYNFVILLKPLTYTF